MGIRHFLRHPKKSWPLRAFAPARSGPEALEQAHAKVHFGQFGEDVIIGYLFQAMGIEKPTYLDIGAFDPVLLSNTYGFYRSGAQGVLVEPNNAYAAKLRTMRPRDTVVEAAIRTQEMPESVEFFVMSAPSLSTIVASEADYAAKSGAWGKQKIEEVRRVSALTANEVMERHLPNGVNLLSIDVEGLDFEIVAEFDFARYKPDVVCIEINGGHYMTDGARAAVWPQRRADDFVVLMEERGYRLAVPVMLNGIFVRG